MGSKISNNPARVRLAAALSAIGAAAAPALADFNYPDFNDMSGLSVIHGAESFSGALRLTDTGLNQASVVWTTNRVTVADGFVSTFNFRISNPGGYLDPLGAPGGDGFAFVIQNMSGTGPAFSPAITGGGMGFNGMTNTVAIAFDTWQNVNALDLDNNHISVVTNGTGVVTPSRNYSIGYTSVIPDMSDGAIHTGRIAYTPGTMKVYLDDLVTPRLTIPITLDGTLSLTNGRAWVGFTAATGGAYQNQDILDWSYAVVPGPGGLALAGVGLLCAKRRRR